MYNKGWYNTDVKNLEPKDGQQSGTEEYHMKMLKASEKFGKKIFASGYMKTMELRRHI